VAANEDRRYRNAAIPAPETRPINARAGCSEIEERLELSSPQAPLQPPATGHPRGNGGRGPCSPEQELCEALVAAWAPALGDGPRRDYAAHRSRWLTAAHALLERHPRQRLTDALEYMVTDEILGSQALTVTGFAKVADQLIARAYACRQRATTRPARAGAAADGLSWEDARQALEGAVQRHGREGRAAALDELGASSEQLVRFVERVRWTQLCEQPMRFVERRYSELWAEITRQANRPEEHAE
jgi:hypothetical protein